MGDILGDAAGLDVRQVGDDHARLLLDRPLHVGDHAGGVGGQAAPLVAPLGPHADLVEGELLQVGEGEGGGGGGDGVEGAVLRVVLLGQAAVHRDRVHRAQQSENNFQLFKCVSKMISLWCNHF